MKTLIVNKSNNPLPFYQTEGSAGMDLYANIQESIVLKPLNRVLISTGNHIQLDKGQVGLVCSRSGLALKHGIQVLNAPGVLDQDYYLDIGVILINLSNEEFTINPGDRIAQLVVTNYERVEWEEKESTNVFVQGERTGGFGSTGK